LEGTDYLTLCEVMAFMGKNIAIGKTATQDSTYATGVATNPVKSKYFS